jgi:hypothetical protein
MAPSRCGELNLDLPRVRRRAHGSWTLRSDISGILPKAFSDGHPQIQLAAAEKFRAVTICVGIDFARSTA